MKNILSKQDPCHTYGFTKKASTMFDLIKLDFNVLLTSLAEHPVHVGATSRAIIVTTGRY